MGLENVKVGDKVWLGQRNHRAGLWKRLNLDDVVAVTAKKFRVKRHPKDLYDKRSGTDYKDAPYAYYAIATPDEIITWKAEQAQKKADAEAAEVAQQQAYQERAERANRIADEIEMWGYKAVVAGGGAVVFERDDRKYRIEETEQ